MRKIFNCLYVALFRTREDDGVEHSGYMSFLILLSIFHFLVFLLALTSFLGASELGQNFIQIFLESLPEQATKSIEKNTRIIKCSSSKFNESCHSRQYLDCFFFCRLFKDYFKPCISNQISPPLYKKKIT